MEILGEIPVIECERLIIKRPCSHDTQAVKLLAQDEGVYRYLPRFLFELLYDEPIGASRYIESYQVEVLGIFRKEQPDQLLGLLEIYGYSREEGCASIGYRLCRRAWGNGIATEAVEGVLTYLRTRADVRVVYAEVMIGNEASIRVLEKNGFLSSYEVQTADWARDEPAKIYSFVRRF